MKGHAASISPTVSEYLGIRFAQLSTGDLRFAAPVAYRQCGFFGGYIRKTSRFWKGDDRL
jgi:hypothetical protein